MKTFNNILELMAALSALTPAQQQYKLSATYTDDLESGQLEIEVDDKNKSVMFVGSSDDM